MLSQDSSAPLSQVLALLKAQASARLWHFYFDDVLLPISKHHQFAHVIMLFLCFATHHPLGLLRWQGT